ncbi:MAG: hypothetical protein IKK48_03810 [Firmicutes bacterium]|nr:hypothetical protein [Bacillota bacterium]
MEKVVGFFGGDHQTGTTMIAWSFAERLSETGRRVLLLFCSGSNDQSFIAGENGQSIDNLKAALRSGRVEREDLFQCLEKRKGLWILPGTKNSLAAGYFLENTLQILLEGVDDTFDIVVVDGGSDLRLGLTISALNVCCYRYFVVTQQAKCIHRYLQKREYLLGPFGLDGQVILNQYRKDPSLLLRKDVCRILGLEKVTVVPFVEGGWQAEMDQKNLRGTPRFAKAVDGLVTAFTGEEKKVRKWKKSLT